jgi:hypothetical protein
MVSDAIFGQELCNEGIFKLNDILLSCWIDSYQETLPCEFRRYVYSCRTKFVKHSFTVV